MSTAQRIRRRQIGSNTGKGKNSKEKTSKITTRTSTTTTTRSTSGIADSTKPTTTATRTTTTTTIHVDIETRNSKIPTPLHRITAIYFTPAEIGSAFNSSNTESLYCLIVLLGVPVTPRSRPVSICCDIIFTEYE